MINTYTYKVEYEFKKLPSCVQVFVKSNYVAAIYRENSNTSELPSEVVNAARKFGWPNEYAME